MAWQWVYEWESRRGVAMGVPGVGVRVPWESRDWEYESHGVSGLSHGEIFLSEESAASRDPGVLREE